MRFDLPESIKALRAGRKTQTRRRSTYWLKKQLGDRITIVHNGEYLGWAEVREVGRHLLGEMNTASARAEGYESLGDFLRAWQELYGPLDLSEEVIVVRFGDLHWVEAK